MQTLKNSLFQMSSTYLRFQTTTNKLMKDGKLSTVYTILPTTGNIRFDWYLLAIE